MRSVPDRSKNQLDLDSPSGFIDEFAKEWRINRGAATDKF